MPTQYEPKDHIQPLAIAPRAEGVLDQREITIQSYQTTIPFNYEAIDAALEGAWLSPVIRFGVFSRNKQAGKDYCTAILGLQDDLSIRAYDYDARRPLWFSWRDVVVETVSIHYFRDEDGLLRFKTTGGGRRITDDRLCEFNTTFLDIPKEAVTKRRFDLDKVRDMCFGRFSEQLYMLRFSDPSGQEYRSIDHALFQSRQYIDPNAKRLEEIRDDAKVTIESFDSDIDVPAKELVKPIKVRFFLRGLGGSLRLRFPNICYRKEPGTVEEQVRLFYRMVDITENLILDADYYARLPRSLDELDVEWGLFIDNVDLTKSREILLSVTARQEFFEQLDVNEPWQKWQPHLRALDELMPAANVAEHITTMGHALAGRSPRQAASLLAACLADAKIRRVGEVVAKVLVNHVYTVPSGDRAFVEQSLLSWALVHENDGWNIDPDADEFLVYNLRWKKRDVSLDNLVAMLRKLLDVLHARLICAKCEMAELLRCFNWCVNAARELPSNHSGLPPALRLIAEGKVPASVLEGSRVLMRPVDNLEALDDEMLNQFALAPWPCLSAMREDGKAKLQNTGIGVAHAVRVLPTEALFDSGKNCIQSILGPGGTMEISISRSATCVDIEYRKYGATRTLRVPVQQLATSPPPGDTEFEWARQGELCRAAARVLGEGEAPDKGTISRAVEAGALESNGKSKNACRVKVESFRRWMEKQRNLDTDEVDQVIDAVMNEIRSRRTKRNSHV